MTSSSKESAHEHKSAQSVASERLPSSKESASKIQIEYSLKKEEMLTSKESGSVVNGSHSAITGMTSSSKESAHEHKSAQSVASERLPSSKESASKIQIEYSLKKEEMLTSKESGSVVNGSHSAITGMTSSSKESAHEHKSAQSVASERLPSSKESASKMQIEYSLQKEGCTETSGKYYVKVSMSKQQEEGSFKTLESILSNKEIDSKIEGESCVYPSRTILSQGESESLTELIMSEVCAKVISDESVEIPSAKASSLKLEGEVPSGLSEIIPKDKDSVHAVKKLSSSESVAKATTSKVYAKVISDESVEIPSSKASSSKMDADDSSTSSEVIPKAKEYAHTMQKLYSSTSREIVHEQENIFSVSSETSVEVAESRLEKQSSEKLRNISPANTLPSRHERQNAADSSSTILSPKETLSKRNTPYIYAKAILDKSYEIPVAKASAPKLQKDESSEFSEVIPTAKESVSAIKKLSLSAAESLTKSTASSKLSAVTLESDVALEISDRTLMSIESGSARLPKSSLSLAEKNVSKWPLDDQLKHKYASSLKYSSTQKPVSQKSLPQKPVSQKSLSKKSVSPKPLPTSQSKSKRPRNELDKPKSVNKKLKSIDEEPEPETSDMKSKSALKSFSKKSSTEERTSKTSQDFSPDKKSVRAAVKRPSKILNKASLIKTSKPKSDKTLMSNFSRKILAKNKLEKMNEKLPCKIYLPEISFSESAVLKITDKKNLTIAESPSEALLETSKHGLSSVEPTYAGHSVPDEVPPLALDKPSPLPAIRPFGDELVTASSGPLDEKHEEFSSELLPNVKQLKEEEVRAKIFTFPFAMSKCIKCIVFIIIILFCPNVFAYMQFTTIQFTHYPVGGVDEKYARL